MKRDRPPITVGVSPPQGKVRGSVLEPFDGGFQMLVPARIMRRANSIIVPSDVLS